MEGFGLDEAAGVRKGKGLGGGEWRRGLGSEIAVLQVQLAYVLSSHSSSGGYALHWLCRLVLTT